MTEQKQNVQKAVVLKYPEGAEAPFVIAKGKGLLASVIIDEAKKNEIYIQKNSLANVAVYITGDFGTR